MSYGLGSLGIESWWGEIFRRPERPWVPSSILYNGYFSLTPCAQFSIVKTSRLHTVSFKIFVCALSSAILKAVLLTEVIKILSAMKAMPVAAASVSVQRPHVQPSVKYSSSGIRYFKFSQ
jgi:hypothetical protein